MSERPRTATANTALRATANEVAAETPDLLALIDAHLATAQPHPAGTTDRLLAQDRSRGV
ncbi:hypothetical protein VSS74_14525 [Conexibacter stalactiti]|uniref:Uncharacterized protein n=1 Tax=Conexibacter stalactiti TaxID=1940611 RepID=A0ABU4HQG7_9ACTN|nr:hypothetical protein [Conexibacter stalactiti]MDW5595562.1 hypothetical protein [Conexibacter stalactiti]MEC5036204.1 hypothetical protein [Conexibacter stalactiti]